MNIIDDFKTIIFYYCKTNFFDKFKLILSINLNLIFNLFNREKWPITPDLSQTLVSESHFCISKKKEGSYFEIEYTELFLSYR